MRFLLDMGISPRTAILLREIGHEATHLLDENLERMSDQDILTKAREERAILLTHDLDFSDLLAASGETLPSVIVFRLKSMRPENVNRHVLAVVDQHAQELASGSILSVTENRIRLRPLPV